MRTLCVLLMLFATTADAKAPLLVFAAASTADAITAASRAFESKTGVKVQASFAGTNELLRQLKAGAKADLFLAADEASVDSAPKKVARMALLSNELVVIVPENSEIKELAPEQLAKLKSLSIADPLGVPAGKYAKAWLEKAGLWKELEPKLIPALDVRAALAAVESGRAQAGIVYATDASSSKKVRVVYRVPNDAAPRIVYTLALISDSPDAKKLYEFLQSDEGLSDFTRLGFRPAK